MSAFRRTADGNNDRTLFEIWIAVAEFAGILHFRRNPGKLFEQKLAHKTRMPGSTAGSQDNAFGTCQFAQTRLNTAENNASILRSTRPFRQVSNEPAVQQFLLHIMIEAFQLNLIE